jgi:hypothetical protein
VNKTNLTDTVSENALHRYSILFSGVRWVKGNFTLATAGSHAWGNNRKTAHNSQRRVGLKSRPKCVAEKNKKEK